MNDVGTIVYQQEMIVAKRATNQLCRIVVVEIHSNKTGIGSYYYYCGESKVYNDDYDRHFQVIAALEKVKIDRYGERI